MQIRDIYLDVCMYVTTFGSAGTVCVKGAELGHSHFYRMAGMWNVGGVKYQ